MALTGLALAGFVVGHLSGNLLVYVGRDALNSYAEWLKSNPQITWVARFGLLLAFLLHIRTGIVLRNGNRNARPTQYAHESTVQASLASRSMFLTGVLVLVYVVLHLAHFTFGWVDSANHSLVQALIRDGAEVQRHDVYGMLVGSFSNPIYSVLYVAAMLVLGMHLSHGLQSLFQSLGLRHPSYTSLFEVAGRVIAWGLAAAYVTIPLAVLTGVVS